MSFPRDHGAHPDYRIEWWYLTANLEGPDGTAYGAQWTLFRSALAPGEGEGWASPQLWMGHAALTTGETHYSAERMGRGGIGQAGVTLSPFAATIDDWKMTSRAAAGADELSALDISAAGKGFSYALALDAEGPLVLQGESGLFGEVRAGAGELLLLAALLPRERRPSRSRARRSPSPARRGSTMNGPRSPWAPTRRGGTGSPSTSPRARS